MAGNGHIEFYRDARREWRWRAIAANGRIVAESGEGYKAIGDAHDGASIALELLGANAVGEAKERAERAARGDA